MIFQPSFQEYLNLLSYNSKSTSVTLLKITVHLTIAILYKINIITTYYLLLFILTISNIF